MSKRKKSTRKRQSQREIPVKKERYEEIISKYQLRRTVPPKWGVPPKNFWNPRILAFMEAALGHSNQDLERSLQSADVKRGMKKAEPRELIEVSTINFDQLFRDLKMQMIFLMTMAQPNRRLYHSSICSTW